MSGCSWGSLFFFFLQCEFIERPLIDHDKEMKRAKLYQTFIHWNVLFTPSRTLKRSFKASISKHSNQVTIHFIIYSISIKGPFLKVQPRCRDHIPKFVQSIVEMTAKCHFVMKSIYIQLGTSIWLFSSICTDANFSICLTWVLQRHRS